MQEKGAAEYIGGDSRKDKHFAANFEHPIEIVHSSGFSGATRIDRASSNELYANHTDEIHHDQTNNRGKFGFSQ